MNSTLKLHHLILRLSAVLVCALAVSQGIQASTPRLDVISPTRVDAGATNVTVTLSGTSFANDDKVFVNNVDASTSIQTQSGTSLTIAIPDNMLASAGVITFEVRATDSTISATRTLVVRNPVKVNAQPSMITLAASYGNKVAPGSMISLFGTHLATASGSASSFPLPTSINGTQVFLNGEAMSLLYVGDDTGGFGQVNFIMPDSIAAGTVEVLVLSGDGSTTLGIATIEDQAPGVFTLNQTGSGLPIAITTTDGVNYSLVWNQSFQPVPITVGAAGQETFLTLFGTGWRHRSALSAVTVTINGVAAEVTYCGSQPDFLGLDQMNVVIPPSLAGTGSVSIVITIDGKTANSTTITLQ